MAQQFYTSKGELEADPNKPMADKIIYNPIGSSLDQAAQAKGYANAAAARAAGYSMVDASAPGGTSGAAPTVPGAVTTTPTTTDTSGMVKSAYDKYMEGLMTPQDYETRKAEALATEAAAIEARRKQAESIFGAKLQRTEALGKQQISNVEGVQGQSSGFNMSTARLAFINKTQNDIEDAKNNILKEKEAYIATGDYEAQQRADARIQALDDRMDKILMWKVDQIMKNEESSFARDVDIANLQLKIPSGQSVSIGGVEYKGLAADEGIFKGSDLVNLMKNIPSGSTQEITDPATGTTYTLSGLGTGNVNIATDDKGYQYGIDKATGKTLWKSAQPVGKTKTQAGSVTVNMGERTPLYNAGKQIGYQSYDSKTGRVKAFNIDGTEMQSIPAGTTLGTLSAGNPNTDDIQSLIDILISEDQG